MHSFHEVSGDSSQGKRWIFPCLHPANKDQTTKFRDHQTATALCHHALSIKCHGLPDACQGTAGRKKTHHFFCFWWSVFGKVKAHWQSQWKARQWQFQHFKILTNLAQFLHTLLCLCQIILVAMIKCAMLTVGNGLKIDNMPLDQFYPPAWMGRFPLCGLNRVLLWVEFRPFINIRGVSADPIMGTPPQL